MIGRLRFLADEDFDNDIVRGLQYRLPSLDLLRVQDVGLLSALDPTILEWAAEAGRVLLSHDARTLKVAAYDRVARGLPMPGVFLFRQSMPIGRAIEQLLLLAECSFAGEWEGKVRHVPL